MLRARSDSLAGIPNLRNMPFLKYFFGHEDYFKEETQVMIFVTPHRWSPSMLTPMMGQNNSPLYDLPTHVDGGSVKEELK